MKLYQNQSINDNIGLLTTYFKNSHFHIDLSPRELKSEFDQDIFHTKHLCEVKQNRSINEGARAMTIFLKIATVTLTLALEPSNSKLFKILSYLHL